MNHSSKITYKTVDKNLFKLQCVSEAGKELNVHQFPINESTTISDICKMNCPNQIGQRIVRIKDGIIVSIMKADTKVIDLINDGFVYRLDQYMPGLMMEESDTFFVCTRFESRSENQKLNPILVEVANGDTLNALAMRLTYILHLSMDKLNDIKFDVNDDWIARPCGAPNTNTGIILVKPQFSETIPVILVHLGF